MNIDLVEKFCTPLSVPVTEYDSKILDDAEKIEIPFEGEILKGYSWGTGKTILLLHGWGSRASHIAHLGRLMANSGFRMVAYDAPAHSSCQNDLKKTKSNMFECCRAVHAVQNHIGPLYALIGHSFGAACGYFTTAGFGKLKDYKIETDKLILISVPPSIRSMVTSFCKNNNLDSEVLLELKESLEEAFEFSMDEYHLSNALKSISSKTTIIHDTNDEEFPVSDIYSIHKANPRVKLFITEGSGHYKILMNRKMISYVKDYLLEN